MIWSVPLSSVSNASQHSAGARGRKRVLSKKIASAMLSRPLESASPRRNNGRSASMRSSTVQRASVASSGQLRSSST